MRLHSIRFKISVLYTLILGVIFVAYSLIFHVTLKRNLYKDFDNKFRMKTQALINTLSSYLDILGDEETVLIFALNRISGLKTSHPYQRMVESLETNWLSSLNNLGLRSDKILVLDSEGKIFYQTPYWDAEQYLGALQQSGARLHGESMFSTIKTPGGMFRSITVPFTYHGGDVYILHIWTSLDPVNTLLGLRLRYRILFIPAILFIGVFVGNLFASRILQPVGAITDVAKKISSGDLSARVPAMHADAEMQNLVDAFNTMIARLERSFKYIAEFSSHVAHELKTPLAIIRGEAEITLKKKRDTEDYERVIKITLEESQRMLKIIEGLLLLTRLDYVPEAFKFERVDLSLLIKEIFEEARLLAAQRGVDVSLKSLPAPCWVDADKIHLHRVFINLIDNAFKFTPEQGMITMTLAQEHSKVRVSIADTGIGIAEKDLPHIFNKFVRIPKVKSNLSVGVGLGLSIVQTIVRIHHGSIEVRSAEGKGTTFTIILPLAEKT